MSRYQIGDQRVGIERETITGYGDYGEPITERVIVWAERAHFEIQMPSEQQNLTITTSEIAWAFLECPDGVVRAVDDAGEDASFPFFVDNPDDERHGLPAISANSWLWHDGLRYAMRGDAKLNRGPLQHAECICEREQG